LLFSAKLIGTTARVGAAFMAAATVLIALVETHVQPFASLAGTLQYQGIIVSGFLGFGTLVVEILIGSWRSFWRWRAGRIIFIHRRPGTWNYVEKQRAYQLRAALLATNDSDQSIDPTDARVCLRQFGRKRRWQQCFQVHIDGELWSPEHPGFQSSPPLRAHSVTVIALNDIHRVTRSSRSPIFLFELRDQWDRPHCIRLRLEPRPPAVTSGPAPGLAAGAVTDADE
jgi:hypothetical protein